MNRVQHTFFETSFNKVIHAGSLSLLRKCNQKAPWLFQIFPIAYGIEHRLDLDGCKIVCGGLFAGHELHAVLLVRRRAQLHLEFGSIIPSWCVAHPIGDMSTIPHFKKINSTADIRQEVPVDSVGDNPGLTTITERKVDIGPDGKRRLLVRQRIVQAPRDEN